MKIRNSCTAILTASFLILAVIANGEEATPASAATHALPAEPGAVVVSYSVGHHIEGRMMPKSGPELVVKADGTVIVHDPFGYPPDPGPEPFIRLETEEDHVPAPAPPKPAHVTHVAGQLTPGELQELLRFIIDKNDFFNYDSRTVHDEIAALRMLADAPSTTFKVAADGKEHTAWAYAISMDNPGLLVKHPRRDQIKAIYNRLSAMRKRIIDEAKSKEPKNR